MRRIIQANIDRYKELLKTETDPTKLVMERNLLAEQEEKLKKFSPKDKKEAEAFNLADPVYFRQCVGSISTRFFVEA